MAARSAVARVRNVTPRTRGESVVHYTGLLVEVIGWLVAIGAALQAFGAAVTIVVALALVWLGRKVRDR